MKTISFVMSVMLALWASLFVGTAMAADTGAGVCVLGTGLSLNDETGAGPYVGVNVGQNSETAAYDNNEDFEAQCCAETGQPADCFAPV